MKGTDQNEGRAHKDALEELFRHASARERPPESEEAAIRDALHAQWEGMVGKRKKRRRLAALAVAVSVTMAIFAGFILMRSPGVPAPSIPLATIEKVNGAVMVRGRNGEPASKAVAAGQMKSGQEVITAIGSRLALRWRDGTSVRLDQNSELRFTAAGEIDLISGRVYVDTELSDGSSGHLILLTPAGKVSHLGTQYMTSVASGSTRVSVREGRVTLSFQGRVERAGEGQRLVVSLAGESSLEPISTYGELWQWTEALAPSFSSDGRSLSDFLSWVGRESGRGVEYASPGAGQLAAETLLRGDIEMEPMQALKVVLQTTDLVPEVRNGAIVVSFRSAHK